LACATQAASRAASGLSHACCSAIAGAGRAASLRFRHIFTNDRPCSDMRSHGWPSYVMGPFVTASATSSRRACLTISLVVKHGKRRQYSLQEQGFCLGLRRPQDPGDAPGQVMRSRLRHRLRRQRCNRQQAAIARDGQSMCAIRITRLHQEDEKPSNSLLPKGCSKQGHGWISESRKMQV